MAGKKVAPNCGYIGYIGLPPATSSKVAVVSSGGGGKGSMTVGFVSQNTSKALFKDAGGGSSAKHTIIAKAGSVVDKRSGNHVYKQELNYKSSVKMNDKFRGCTTEYETQVKFKKVTTYHTPKASAPKKKSSSGHKKIAY